MGLEIERKFLVKGDGYKSLANPVYMRQGYVPTENGVTVRVRIAGDAAFLTMKSRAVGLVRHEYEYPIPLKDATEMLELLCSEPQVEITGTGSPLPSRAFSGMWTSSLVPMLRS